MQLNIRKITGKWCVNSFLVKLYTTIAIGSTLFELYGISKSLHTFTIRLFMVILFIIFSTGILIVKKRIVFSYVMISFLPFVISLMGSFFINLLLGKSGFELRLLRFFTLLIFSVFLSGEYFDGEYGMKLYSCIVWLATIVMLLQVVGANLWGISISGHLPLPLRSAIYESADYSKRFYSIFEEPGYYGLFVSPYLVIKISTGKTSIIEFLVISVALLLSTSTSNIMLLAFLVCTYLVFMRNDKISSLKLLVMKIAILIATSIAIYVFIHSNQYEFVLMRLQNGSSTAQRMIGYKDIDSLFGGGNYLTFLFGNAMETYPISGYATMLITFGIIGTITYLYGLFRMYTTTNRTGKYLLLLFMFINIGNVEFLGNASSMLIVYPFCIWLSNFKD